MTQNTRSPQEQAEQRIAEEAYRIAKATQVQGQTKEQTKLIAKGIEKGIALYRQQQNQKARERDKTRKKMMKLKTREQADLHEPVDQDHIEEADGHAAKPALLVAGGLFSVGAVAHVLRLVLAWDVSIAGFSVPAGWSLPGGLIAGALAFWMFRTALRED